MGHDQEESSRIVCQLLEEKVDAPTETLAAWPSGRTLHVQAETHANGDRLLIHNPHGTLELCLEFGPTGPRLIVPGGELTVESSNLSFNANCMNFKAKSDVNWQVDGEFNISSKNTKIVSSGDVAINGKFVKLNCDQEVSNSLIKTKPQSPERDN